MSATEEENARFAAQCILVARAANSLYYLAPQMRTILEGLLAVLATQDASRVPQIAYDGMHAIVQFGDGSEPFVIECYPKPADQGRELQ